MPRPFRLCAIGMSRHMTAQLLPIQLARTARAWALVGDTARLEPAVDARRTHLKPPRRFGLAASTANTRHDPLAQIC